MTDCMTSTLMDQGVLLRCQGNPGKVWESCFAKLVASLMIINGFAVLEKNYTIALQKITKIVL